MDYTVRDSSILGDAHAFSKYDSKDCAVRIGIVREDKVVSDGSTRYVVEVATGGRQIPISCRLLNRFGGVYNYEEYRLRGWAQNFPKGIPVPAPQTASKYKLRSGDVVLVAYLEGQSREGVIIGGLTHPARTDKTTPGNIEYISEFNGMETQIRKDGSYKVTFKGSPINTAALSVLPTGTPIPDPIYGPSAGSFYGFEKDGSFIVSDGSQYIKIIKSPTGGTTQIKSGNSTINLGGNAAESSLGFKSDKLFLETTTDINIKAKTGITAETIAFSIKAINIALGNDQIELIDGLLQLIDALGTIVVTSPVGTCTPLMAAPTWTAQIIPLKVKLSTLKSSVASADPVEVIDAGDITLSGDIGS